MPNDLEVFHFEDGRPNFEAYGHQNGFRYWLASDLMVFLDYASMQAIRPAINRAIAACAQLDISISENFEEVRGTNGDRDWKLSRFACYLTVMNADPKKRKVAEAQAYFVTMAEAFRQYIQEAESVERVVIRGEVSEREKAISGTVYSRGVINYAFFQNAGYRGMYNLDLSGIKRRKRIPGRRSPLDYMGKTELAANLFRITQTEEKIRNEDITGQRPLENAAWHVGNTVRKTMIELSGTAPENLPAERDIVKVKGDLKRVGREYARIDTHTK